MHIDTLDHGFPSCLSLQPHRGVVEHSNGLSARRRHSGCFLLDFGHCSCTVFCVVKSCHMACGTMSETLARTLAVVYAMPSGPVGGQVLKMMPTVLSGFSASPTAKSDKATQADRSKL